MTGRAAGVRNGAAHAPAVCEMPAFGAEALGRRRPFSTYSRDAARPGTGATRKTDQKRIVAASIPKHFAARPTKGLCVSGKRCMTKQAKGCCK
jgi:hypothetical protein